jgi:hypothetical protein
MKAYVASPMSQTELADIYLAVLKAIGHQPMKHPLRFTGQILINEEESHITITARRQAGVGSEGRRER